MVMKSNHPAILHGAKLHSRQPPELNPPATIVYGRASETVRFRTGALDSDHLGLDFWLHLFLTL